MIGLLGLVIGILHLLAINLFLYWDIVWFDVLMHFLGGVWIALLGFWVMAFFTHQNEFSLKNIVLISLTFSLGIGILWEVFEYTAGLTFVAGQDVWLDTFSDLFFDILGGSVAGLFMSQGYRKENTPV